jgi:hypothetical protein
VLLLALHCGDEVRRMTSWLGHDVEVDLVLHDPAEVVAAVTATGLEDVEWYVRGPIGSRQETTDRLYVLARRPV